MLPILNGFSIRYGEREIFQFCQGEGESHDIEAWLASTNGAGKERSRVYYEMFQSELQERDWENHSKREEWIAEIRQGKGRFVAQGGPPEEWETRKAFADWAIVNNLVWGNER
jgi:hypothetical protein